VAADARLRISQICRFCVTDGVPRRSFVVALVVGTILNLINQGDALFEGGTSIGFMTRGSATDYFAPLEVSHAVR
jgi:hypothetical protein